MAKVFDKFEALNSNTTDPRVRRYLTPKRVVLTQGLVTNPEAVLLERTNQITLDAGVRCTLRNVEGQPNAAILVDFGIEFPGSCSLLIWNVLFLLLLYSALMYHSESLFLCIPLSPILQ